MSAPEKITRGDVFYVSPSEGEVGSEQAKSRPGIVVSNNLNNKHSDVVEVVYLTRKQKKPLPTHVPIELKGQVSTALCEQIDSVSTERLGRHMGHIRYRELVAINDALAISLALENGG